MEVEGYSYSVGHPFVYKWLIKDITFLINCASNNLNSLYSPEFSTGAKINDTWYIRLQTYKTHLDHSPYEKKQMLVELYPKNEEGREIRIKYGMYILNNKGEKISPLDKNLQERYTFKNHAVVQKDLCHVMYINADELLVEENGFIQNDTLTIGVDLIVYDDFTRINNSISLLKGSERTLANDLKDLLVAKKKSDFVIKVGNQTFDVHKVLLIARSSMFEAMFSHDMKENEENEVTLSDVDPEVFEKVLEFIYTDKVDELDDFAEELLEAADQYQLDGLKEKCEDFLAKDLSIENAVRIMVLADRHCAERLKKVATTYILINFVEVQKTEGFEELTKSHPSVAFTLVKKYFSEINDQ